MQHPRPTDIVVAEADLAEAKAAVAVAQSSLALTELRAPSDGQILKIVTYAGEQPGDRGVLLFGNTGAMQIKAEVDISELAHVHVGALAAGDRAGLDGHGHRQGRAHRAARRSQLHSAALDLRLGRSARR